MIEKNPESKKDVLVEIARLMSIAARTAPKTRGVDNLVIATITGKDIKRLINKMQNIARAHSKASFKRDADNLKHCKVVLTIGTKTAPLDLTYCGYCGFKDCGELLRKHGVCAYNSMDLGIAVLSAAIVAARFFVDNRIMYSVGKAAIELGLLGEDVRLAIGIPLSVTGKNIFFDRT